MLVNLAKMICQFRTGQEAFTLDLEKFYNQVKLSPEHYRFQKCLLKEDFIEASPAVVHVIRTLIYGNISAGN